MPRSPRMKGYAQRTRQFSGKRFQIHDVSTSHKSDARKVAKRLRENGWNARIVRTANRYRIYKRRS